MPLTVCSPNEGRPLKAWEGMDPNEGVKTRHRSAGSASAPSTSQQESPPEISPTNENKLQTGQRKASEEGCGPDLTLADTKKVKEDVHVRGTDGNSTLSSKQQSRQILNVVTICEDNISEESTTVIPFEGSDSTSVTESDLQIREDGEKLQPQTFSAAEHDQKLSPISGSPKQTSTSMRSSWQQYWDTVPVFEPVMPAHMPTEPSFHTEYHNNNEISLHALQDTLLTNNFEGVPALQPNLLNSDEETDSSSTISMDNTQETIDQLKAANEDLMSANEYYRLMSDIAMKASALRRGCE